MEMKVGVLTLPLHANYGGNLQAWALMTVLRRMGHDVWLIDMARYRTRSWRIPLILAKRMLLKYGLRRSDVVVGKGLLDGRRRARYEGHARRFIADHIKPRTQIFHSTEQLSREIREENFDAIVVGSDQVWRPEYAPNVEDYFLGFLADTKKIRRVSYAASFGTSEWRFSHEQSARCSALLKKFNAVSVRELSATTLCREKFDVEASHVVDPTLLLDADDYLELLPAQERASHTAGKLFVYLLDKDPSKQGVLNAILRKTGLSSFDVHAGTSNDDAPDMNIAPPIERWIQGFRDADFVFTDSFHGCVFSILFNKPFIVYGNPHRGLARFESLLGMFNLAQRMIDRAEAVEDLLDQPPIDWRKVMDILNAQRVKSRQFLVNALDG